MLLDIANSKGAVIFTIVQRLFLPVISIDIHMVKIFTCGQTFPHADFASGFELVKLIYSVDQLKAVLFCASNASYIATRLTMDPFFICYWANIHIHVYKYTYMYTYIHLPNYDDQSTPSEKAGNVKRFHRRWTSWKNHQLLTCCSKSIIIIFNIFNLLLEFTLGHGSSSIRTNEVHSRTSRLSFCKNQ